MEPQKHKGHKGNYNKLPAYLLYMPYIGTVPLWFTNHTTMFITLYSL